MEYVPGEPLHRLLRGTGRRPLPPGLASGVLVGVLAGLHAAHEARDDLGEPLGVVHRDVSPQNILVGVDGVPRVLDFGIAKAQGRLQETTDISVKGKLRYMAPEQLRRSHGTGGGPEIDRRADVFAASIVLWEMLTGRPLFEQDDMAGTVSAILDRPVTPPSALSADVPPALDAVVLRGLERDRERRFSTAAEMAEALTAAAAPASSVELARWVNTQARSALEGRAEQLARIEEATLGDEWPPVHLLTETKPERAGRPFWARAALVALAVVVPVAGVWSFGGRPSSPSAHTPEAPRPPRVEQPVVVAPEPVAPGEPVAEPRRPPHRTAATAVRRPRSKPAAPKLKPAAPAVDCDIPFVITSSGARIPKVGCFNAEPAR